MLEYHLSQGWSRGLNRRGRATTWAPEARRPEALAPGRPGPGPAGPDRLPSPFRLRGGLGAGAESRKPLGMAVVGGLLFSTLLTLVPVVYSLFARFVGRTAEEEVTEAAREQAAAVPASGIGSGSA